jgi:tetratricopeptide (TPR) repeat protein
MPISYTCLTTLRSQLLAGCFLPFCLFAQSATACLAKSDPDAEVYFEKAIAESRESPTQDQALRDFEKAIKLSPHTAKYHAYQADLLFALEEDEAALAAANMAIKLDPRCDLAWFVLAKAQGRLKRPQESLKSINTAIGLSPNNPMFFVTRSRLLVVQNRWEEAEKDLDKVVPLQPKLGIAYSDRIKICEHLKKWPKVVADCATYMKLDPGHRSFGLRSRAEAYVAMHDYARAVIDLKAALKMWPDDIKIHKVLQDVYKTIGDKKGLAEEDEKIKSINRDI